MVHAQNTSSRMHNQNTSSRRNKYTPVPRSSWAGQDLGILMFTSWDRRVGYKIRPMLHVFSVKVLLEKKERDNEKETNGGRRSKTVGTVIEKGMWVAAAHYDMVS